MVRIPSSLAEAQARAPECKALVDDMKNQLGDSHTMTFDDKQNTVVPMEGHEVFLVGHTGRNGGTKTLDVCTDEMMDFFLNTLAEKGTMWELTCNGVMWTFL